MRQIYEAKVITLTRGGLAGGIISVVTTNCKKSAEVIVPKIIFSGRTEQS